MNNKAFHLLACLIFAAISCCSATEELTSMNFHQKIHSGQNGLVKFYQSWCGHCTRMKPDWDRLAEEAPPSVFIHDVNCGDEPDLCKDNGVTGYPTIKYYLNGEDHKYEGGRGFDPLMTFVSETLQQKCDVTKLKETCNDKAQTYAEKWLGKDMFDVQKEKVRLEGMASKDMKPDLKSWVRERIFVLAQISTAKETAEL